MFFLKKIFQKKLNIEEVEDLLYESGVEPKFADIIVSKIKDKGSKEDDLRKLIKSELLEEFKEKKFGNFTPQTKSLMVITGNNGSGKTTFIGKFIQYFQQNNLKLERLDGMKLNIFTDKWSMSNDKSVNYIAKFVKN